MPTNLTSSGVTFPDASQQTTADAQVLPPKVIEYNSPGTYSKTSNISYIYVELYGGSGGGGGGGQPGSGNPGGAGGTTSFGSLASANGGNGGSGGGAANGTATPGTNGAGGSTGTTTFNIGSSFPTLPSAITGRGVPLSTISGGGYGNGGVGPTYLGLGPEGNWGGFPYNSYGGRGGSGGQGGKSAIRLPGPGVDPSIPITIGSGGNAGSGGGGGASAGTSGKIKITEVYGD